MIADFVKLANSAAGTFAGMTREARDSARERLKEAMGGLDFVTREEFDAVKDMAGKAREDNLRLEAKLAALEAKLSGSTATSAVKAKTTVPNATTDPVRTAGDTSDPGVTDIG